VSETDTTTSRSETITASVNRYNDDATPWARYALTIEIVYESRADAFSALASLASELSEGQPQPSSPTKRVVVPATSVTIEVEPAGVDSPPSAAPAPARVDIGPLYEQAQQPAPVEPKPAPRTRAKRQPEQPAPVEPKPPVQQRAFSFAVRPVTMSLEERKELMPATEVQPYVTTYLDREVPREIREATSFDAVAAWCVANTPDIATKNASAFSRAMLELRNAVPLLGLMHDGEVVHRAEELFATHWFAIHSKQLEASPLPEVVLDEFVSAATVADAVLLGVQFFNTDNATVLVDELLSLGPACPSVYGAVETQRKAGKLTPEAIKAQLQKRIATCVPEVIEALREREVWGESGYVSPVE